jgi:endonuclease III
MNARDARSRLATVIRSLAVEKRSTLERLKAEHVGLERPDFVWHYLLQSFSTMGRAAGWQGLIGNEQNYRRVTYEVIKALPQELRDPHVRLVCQQAKIRMPNRKTEFILGCFELIEELGGLGPTKAKLLAEPGRERKIRFLDAFPGIGPKYARNIMMDVYHEDFRDSIAIDIRIQAISTRLGVSFSSYEEHEAFYLRVAQEAGINGWELDRLLFNFRREVEARLA